MALAAVASSLKGARALRDGAWAAGLQNWTRITTAGTEAGNRTADDGLVLGLFRVLGVQVRHGQTQGSESADSMTASRTCALLHELGESAFTCSLGDPPSWISQPIPCLRVCMS